MKFLYYDFEIYKNFWLVVFKDTNRRRVVIHSRMDYVSALVRLENKLDEFVFVGFNNARYDTVMLNYIIKNFKRLPADKMALEMYEMSKEIIVNRTYYKQVMASKGVPDNTYEMDVSTFLANRVGAKEMGCRMHHPKLENLPFHPDKLITDEEVPELIEYCDNDVDIVITIATSSMVAPEMQAIWDIIDYFGLGKEKCGLSIGALIEEALVNPALKANPPKRFRYKPPVEMNFKTQEFKDILETYMGLMLEPESNFSMKIDIGDMKVSLGLGGIHGAVSQSYFTNLIDIDAKQYYPDMVRKYDLLPNTVENKENYYKMIDDKEEYGRIGDKREKSIKKGINSIFGRTGFKNSKLYAPDKLYAITITGQLLILRLVEDLQDAGYEVVYLNTDGLTILDNGTTEYKAICDAWAKEFGFKLKLVPFKKAFYRDVNNFVVDVDGDELKRKGDFNTEPSRKRSCFAKVSVDAVVEHLLNGVPIREYINTKTDMREFLMYHKYNHDMDVFLISEGSKKPLSNVVRYILVDNKDNAIVHQKQGKDTLENRNENNNVELVNEFNIEDYIVPMYDNIDMERYVTIAYDILYKITGKDVEDNPYVESLLEKLEELK